MSIQIVINNLTETPPGRPVEGDVGGGPRRGSLELPAGAVQRAAGGERAAPARAGAAPRLARRPHTAVLNTRLDIIS